MAIPKLPLCTKFLFAFLFFAGSINASLVHVPLKSVNDALIRSALDSLNEYSPTHNTYRSGSLISAQKLLGEPYVTYKLTLNLEAVCNEATPCPREVCAIELRQHELGDIDVEKNSVVCVYLNPQSDEAGVQQVIQDGTQDGSVQDQELFESYDKKSANSSVQLDHEIQTVADSTERPFIAVPAGDRSYCAGCPYELNPTLPGLAVYGEQAVRSMDESSRSEFKHRLVNIVRVTRAVPPGSNIILYELLLEIGETNCPRMDAKPRSECAISSDAPVSLCLVTFEQRPWKQDSRKIVRNNCTDFPEDGALAQRAELTSHAPYASESSPDLRSQATRSQTDLEKKLGPLASSIDEFFDVGPAPVSTPEPESIQSPVKEDTLKKVVLEGKDDVGKVKRFEDKYRAYDDFLRDINFNVSVRNGPPKFVPDPRVPVNEELIRPEVVMSTNDGQSSATREIRSETRERRSLDDKELSKYLAQIAVDELDEIDDDKTRRILQNVIDSRTQPGDGSVYYIKMNVTKSNCPEGKIYCADELQGATIICKAIVQLHDPRFPETAKVKNTQCFDERARRDSRARRALVGAPSQTNTSDPNIQEYVRKALKKLSVESEKENEPHLVEIVGATRQVVSGLKYKIMVKLGESTCKKGEKNDCRLKSDSEIYDYVITVWTQPWKENGNPKIKIESLQKNAKMRVRRSQNIPGGINDADINDPEILNYTKKALHNYTQTFWPQYEPYLVRILEAKKQVVSGMLYTILVTVGESTCPRGVKQDCQLKADSDVGDYEIRVWSQPWLDHGNPEITFKLNKDQSKISKRSLRGRNYSQRMLMLGQGLNEEHSVSLEDRNKFERFMNEHKKSYSSDEERSRRLQIFTKNMRKIDDLRANERGTAEYGATMFADLTYEEFKARHLGLRPNSLSENEIPLPMANIPDVQLPESFDWRDKNVITEVKNQGSCGSCWAFSVTGNVEALNAIKNGKLLSLSEQELVDCDAFDSGCEGGLPTNAYRAIEQMGGLETESDYPYDGQDEKCHFDKSKARVNIVSGVNITSNETQMAQWLVQNGPITIGINANAMQFYMGGISHPFKFLCSGDNLDHGVLIVGYGIHTYPIFKNKKMPYWIIKNSWGPRWGEQGYYRVYRGDGTCGVNRMASSAVIA